MELGKQTIRVVAAVIERDGRYLITQRRQSAVLPMLWEFPGGKCESGESDTDALKREVLERLGASIEVRDMISFVNHEYEHYVIHLFLHECNLIGDSLSALTVHDYKWVRSEDFERYPFTPADEASMTQLLGLKL